MSMGATIPVRHTGPCSDSGIIGPGPCSSGLACELCDVSGYAPTPMAKPATSNACSSKELAAFTTACFGPNATQQTCQAWQTSEPDGGSCAPCLFTLQSAASWGPLVCTSAACSLNTGGCVDLVSQQVNRETAQGGTGSCGDLVSASYGCTDYACGTCDATGSPSDFDTCSQAATAVECKSYADAVSSPTGACGFLNGDASSAATCFPQTNNDVTAFLNVFCGTGP
jgi:hypothetical protein